jgi:UDP-N-acetylglucosamine 2-epimerase
MVQGGVEGMKIVTVVGARPQFIKAAAVNRAIQAISRSHRSFGRPHSKKKIQEILVHTGQHYDYLMDRVFFDELKLPKPDYHLGVGSGSHARQTAMMLERIESVLEREKPEVVLVYGDTNSTLSGALAAAKLNIPVAHVEAGLRSYNRTMPEEINRLLTDHLSTFLFCPTHQAVQNLLKEGIKDGKTKVVKKVGDVMYDSILYYSDLAEKKSTILQDLGLVGHGSFVQHPTLRHAPRRVHGSPEPHMVQGAVRIPNYYLATLHRAENTDTPKRLKSILKALNEIGKDVPILLPLHPRTKKIMKAYHLFPETQRITLIDPVSYLDMLKLEKNAKAILTDSGGVQKEAYWFGVPCFTLRDETEWVETIHSGWNILVGTGKKKIVEEVRQGEGRKRPPKKRGIFGDGKASEKIVRMIAGVL